MAAPEIEVWGTVAQQGVWGTEVPQRGPGAEPLVGLRGAKPPENGDLGAESPEAERFFRMWGLICFDIFFYK